ncbi:MAG TPA: SMC-Scp complex subunit ScpB [Burkholderiales bacterium]|nr:SMC-Scp complex subunit ScpB [Burkholderiales bacterium]
MNRDVVIEAALLASDEALSVKELLRLFDEGVDRSEIEKILSELQQKWIDSGLQLVEVAGGWRFRTRLELKPYLDRLNLRKAPRYSRAALETLAIIAYKQPVTRGDIEEIRGVAVSSQILKAFEERAWVEVVGHREVPGRPALYATTSRFLDDLNLNSISDLPLLDDIDFLFSQHDKH